MRAYAKVLPQFWIDVTGQALRKQGPLVQLVALYLLTCPHATMLGVYYLPLSYIAHETGIALKHISKIMKVLCESGVCSYDAEQEYVWTPAILHAELSKPLTPTDNRIKAFQRLYAELPPLSFRDAFYTRYQLALFLSSLTPFEGPCKDLRSQEQKQEKEQKQEETFLSRDDNQEKEREHYFDSVLSLPEKKTGEYRRQAEHILHFLNSKTGKAFRPVETNLTLIMARLKSGATPTECRQVIVKKIREWSQQSDMQKYLRPATLFNARKFEQYLGELVLPKEEGSTHDTPA